MPTFQTFKDLSVTFKSNPVTNDLVVVKDKAAIMQSIISLLQTNKGERPFKPDLGCDIRNSLFEPLDYATAGIIRSQIIETVGRYEPRVVINNVVVTPDEMTNSYEVELSFTIVGRDDVPVTAEFLLERTR